MLETLPKVVFHYTSLATLLKIVKSQQIWATSIRYLNDVSERSYALSEIKKRVEQGPLLIQNLFPDQIEEIDKHRSFDELPFVASFSGLSDSLPQWRSYCPNGNGVSIGFSTESLKHASLIKENAADQQAPVNKNLDSDPLDFEIDFFSIAFQPVLYPKEGDCKAFDETVERLIAEARREEEDYDPPEYTDESGRMVTEDVSLEEFVAGALDKTASRIKNPSFEAENEFRLIVRLLGASMAIQYRSTKTTLVPYVPLSIPNPSAFAKPRETVIPSLRPFFIDSVKIGPTPNPKLTKQALQQFFWGRGYDVTVDESGVPFRDWL